MRLLPAALSSVVPAAVRPCLFPIVSPPYSSSSSSLAPSSSARDRAPGAGECDRGECDRGAGECEREGYLSSSSSSSSRFLPVIGAPRATVYRLRGGGDGLALEGRANGARGGESGVGEVVRLASVVEALLPCVAFESSPRFVSAPASCFVRPAFQACCRARLRCSSLHVCVRVRWTARCCCLQ